PLAAEVHLAASPQARAGGVRRRGSRNVHPRILAVGIWIVRVPAEHEELEQEVLLGAGACLLHALVAAIVTLALPPLDDAVVRVVDVDDLECHGCGRAIDRLPAARVAD